MTGSDRDAHALPSARAIPLLRLLLVLAALFFASACANSSPPLPEGHARPPFVRMETERGPTLFLLGTFHLGPPGGWRLSPEIEHVLVEADTLVLELAPDAVDPSAVGSALAQRVVLPVGIELADVVAPETQALLEAHDEALSQAGMSANARRRLKPWYIAISLAEKAVAGADLSFETAVESELVSGFRGTGTVGLETFEAQLDALDGLPPDVQDLLLRDTVQHLDEASADLLEETEAWRRADRDALEAQALMGIDESPDLEPLRRAMLDDRNRRWMPQLTALLEDAGRRDETVLVAVGALHMVGEVGLPALLEKAGYTVHRIH